MSRALTTTFGLRPSNRASARGFPRRKTGEQNAPILIFFDATIKAPASPEVRVLIPLRGYGGRLLVPFFRRFLPIALAFACVPAFAQSLVVYSGNGQMVLEQFLTTQPLTVQARDASGRPVANIPINWSVSGLGTLRNPVNTTDANGLASVTFLASAVPGGNSYSQATITASSPAGNAIFYVTTTLSNPPALPLVELLAPPAENRSITGAAGATIGNALQVNVTVQSGPQTGQPVPNIGIRVYNYDDPEQSPSGICQGDGGIVLTNSQGRATCNLMLNQRTGNSQISLIAGEAQITPRVNLTITPGAPCVYSLSPGTQTFPFSGGPGVVTLNTAGTCAWTATTTTPWISLSGVTIGSGPASIPYTVLANPTASERVGSIVIANQTLTVRQSATGTSVLSFTNSSTLPNATVNQPFSFTFSATGGTTPYSWAATGLPQGLVLSPNNTQAILSGTPAVAGSTTFNLTVTDFRGSSFSQAFTLTVLNEGGSPNPIFTNGPLRAGTVGQQYQDYLTSTAGCQTNPFGTRPRFALVSGSLPPGLRLESQGDGRGAILGVPTTSGAFTFTASVTDVCNRSSSATFSIIIRSGTGGTNLLFSNPEVLTFNVTPGTSVADQPLTIDYSGVSTSFTATASNTGAVRWLAINGATSGNTPRTISVGLQNLSQLSPGTYNGTILITTAGSSLNVPVILNLGATQTLTASPNTIQFNTPLVQTPTTLQQIVTVSSSTPARITARIVLQTPGPNWLSVTPELVESATRADFTVRANPLGLGQGSYLGFVTFDAGSGPLNVPVTLTVGQTPIFTVSPTAMTFLQELGAGVSVPQILALNAGTAGVRYQATASASGGNWLSVSPAEGQTPANLTVAVNPQGLNPGTYSGSVTVRSVDGTVPPVTVRVTYTINQAIPVINIIKNAAATTSSGKITPGMLIEIYGAGLGPAEGVLSAIQINRLETRTAGTRILFDGVAAPLLFVRNDQVNAIVPYSTSNRLTTRIAVEVNGIQSFPLNYEVTTADPAIFAFPGISQGKILNQDNTLNAATNGADPDSIIQVFATGEGVHEANTQFADGTITNLVLSRPRLPVTARIDGITAEVVYAGTSPGLVAGVLQVNLRVPGNVRRFAQVPLEISVGGVASPSGVTVAIR